MQQFMRGALGHVGISTNVGIAQGCMKLSLRLLTVASTSSLPEGTIKSAGGHYPLMYF